MAVTRINGIDVHDAMQGEGEPLVRVHASRAGLSSCAGSASTRRRRFPSRRRFIEELALGPGAWDLLPEPIRAIFLGNAPAFVAEQRDPGWSALDTDAVAEHGHRILLTKGTTSPRYLQLLNDRLAEALPKAETAVIEGAGHSPHITHPEPFAKLIGTFLGARAEVAANAP